MLTKICGKKRALTLFGNYFRKRCIEMLPDSGGNEIPKMFGMPVNKPAQFIYINELKAAVLVIFMNFAFGAVGYGAIS